MQACCHPAGPTAAPAVSLASVPTGARRPAVLGTDTWHRIDDSLQVFVHLDAEGTGWQLDAAAVDRHPLTGLPGGLDGSECTCSDRVGHERAHERAAAVQRPTGEELMRLLADAYGYEVHPRP